jgi:hypothetical protein
VFLICGSWNKIFLSNPPLALPIIYNFTGKRFTNDRTKPQEIKKATAQRQTSAPISKVFRVILPSTGSDSWDQTVL